MQKTGDNEYKCDPSEWIQINFTAFPSRENVNIKKSWDDEPLQDVNQNFIRKKFNGSKMKLTISFSFILHGKCDIEITGNNGVVDNDEAVEIGIPNINEYTFVP